MIVEVSQNAPRESTWHNLILHGLWGVTLERQINLLNPSVTLKLLVVQNGRKCIIYIDYIIKQLLTYVWVDMEC